MTRDSVISQLYGPLQKIVREAGAIARDKVTAKHSLTYKSDGSFATEVDVEVENFLKKRLEALIPDAAIIAEESGEKKTFSPWSWVIDPIDGTTNFSRGIPLFAVSVALLHNDLPVVGMTYDPMRDELFHAAQGKGCYLNDFQCTVSSRDLPEALIGFDLPFVPQELSSFLKVLEILSPSVYGIRKIGSACLDFAYIAAGRTDGALLTTFKWWDVAAGMVLIQEAGGLVSTFKGGELNRASQSCVAANSLIFDSFRKLLSSL